MRLLVPVKAVLMVLALLLPVLAGAQEYTYTQEQLDELLAPIALYPDPLLSQILMASTYPAEVADADRFVRGNAYLTGDRLDEALLNQPWDPSVKSLCHYPDILATMAGHMDETVALGDAFLGQPDQVMDTVQDLRRRAYGAGHLRSTPEQRVLVEDPYIVVEPVGAEIIYVPVYDPCWVYGPWWWPSCLRLWFWYPGVAVEGAFIFGRPVRIGHRGFWCGFHWRQRSIFVDPQRTVAFNRIPATRAYAGEHAWAHDPAHRRGIAYRSPQAVKAVPAPGPGGRAGYRGFTAPAPGVEAPAPAGSRPRGQAPGSVERPSAPAPSGVERPRTEAPAPSGTARSRPSSPAAIEPRTGGQPAAVAAPAAPRPMAAPTPSPRTGALSAPPTASPYTRQESERGRSSLKSVPGRGELSPAPPAARAPAPQVRAPAPAAAPTPLPRPAPAPHIAPAAPPHPAPAAPAPHIAPPAAPHPAPPAAHPGGQSRERR